MSRAAVSQTSNQRAGAALRAWRYREKLSLEALAAKLETRVEGRTPKASLIAKWERGVAAPGDGYFAALADLGAPVEGWRNRARAEVAPPEQPAIDAGIADVQRMLIEGRPPSEVYTVASRLMAAQLAGGLSPDRHRAFQMLLRTLQDAAKERGKVPPLSEHPDYLRESEALLDDLEVVLRRRLGSEAGEALAELAELQRARAERREARAA